MNRSGGAPLPVVGAGGVFLLCGLAFASVLLRLGTISEGDTARTTLILAIGVGVALIAIGVGILVGRRWARILGLLIAVLAALAGVAGLVLTAWMALGMGIGFPDRLFLEPAAFMVVVIVLAIACVVVLARHRAWFLPRIRSLPQDQRTDDRG